MKLSESVLRIKLHVNLYERFTYFLEIFSAAIYKSSRLIPVLDFEYKCMSSIEESKNLHFLLIELSSTWIKEKIHPQCHDENRRHSS